MNELQQAELALVTVVNALDNAADECEDRVNRILITSVAKDADRLLLRVQNIIETAERPRD